MSGMDLQQQQQQHLIKRIIAAEMHKVRREAKDDIEAIRVASEERLRQQLKEFQDRERDLHNTFKKAVDRAEAFGRRQAEKKIQHEMEALVANADAMENKVVKIEGNWRKKEQAWHNERFEMEVVMKRLEDRSYRQRKQMKKLLRSIKLEFKYSLSEAEAELKDQCRDVVCKTIERELREPVRQQLLESESARIQSMYRNFQDGTYWNLLYRQIASKQRLHNELVGMRAKRSDFYSPREEIETSFIRTVGLNHVASPVLKPMLKWTAASPAPSIIENVLSPAVVDDSSQRNKSSRSKNQRSKMSYNAENVEFCPDQDDEFCYDEKIEKGKLAGGSNPANRSLLWPSGKTALHDRTNENILAEKDAFMSSLKNIDLPKNPFQTSFVNILKSNHVDIVPKDSHSLVEGEDVPQHDDETTISVHSPRSDEEQGGISTHSPSYNDDDDDEETVTMIEDSQAQQSASVLWKMELQAEAKFLRESPELLEDIVSDSGDEISSKSLGKLLKLWGVVGIPSNTRLRTLQSIHSAAEIEPEKAKVIVHKMCEKLLAFIDARKKEVLAIRKREEMKFKLADNPSLEPTFDKLSAILVRVISRWEGANGQQFLYRGIPYIEMLAMDGFR